jgi:hypothetical protein
MRLKIPKMSVWEQIGGDMNPGTYGGIIARSDGDALELLQIQPVREYVGDREAAEVGFPYWSKEGYYDLDDLDPQRDDVQSALSFVGLDEDALEDLTPTQRALAIAEALLQYGVADEGPAGWADDVVPDKVKWWSGTVEGPSYFSDEDDDFRRDILGEDDEDEDD